MSIRCVIGLFLISWLALGPETGFAGESNCLAKAAEHVGPGEWLRVIKQDKAKETGQLESFDLPNSRLILQQTIDSLTTATTYELSDINAIQYHGGGRIRPGYMLLGLFGGGLLGVGIGGLFESGGDSGCNFGPCFEVSERGYGFLIGAGAGLLAGTFIPLLTHSTRTIKCE